VGITHTGYDFILVVL